MINYWAIAIFIVLNVIGILLLVRAQSVHSKANKASQWPSTSATILESELTEEPGRNAVGNINVAYLLTVKYEYEAAGQTHIGNRVTFGTPAFNYITGSNLLEAYQPGKKIPVYYDPANPSDCVLAPKNTTGMLSRVPGIFLIAAGFLVGILSFL
mgnify:FL=1